MGGVAWPQPFLQLLPRDQPSGPLDKKPQNANGLVLNVEADPMLLDFAGFEIDPKRAKGIDGMGIRHGRHRSPEPRLTKFMWGDANMAPSLQQLTNVKFWSRGHRAEGGAQTNSTGGGFDVVQCVAQFGNSGINTSPEFRNWGGQIQVR